MRAALTETQRIPTFGARAVEAFTVAGQKVLAIPQLARDSGFLRAAKDAAAERRANVAEAGFAVASVEYRTALHGAIYSDGIADVKSALRYLRAHARRYGIDGARAGVWGESAGGYLAAMAGVTNGLKQFDRGDHLDQSSDFQAVVDMFGAGDLTELAADIDPETQEFFSGAQNSIA